MAVLLLPIIWLILLGLLALSLIVNEASSTAGSIYISVTFPLVELGCVYTFGWVYLRVVFRPRKELGYFREEEVFGEEDL